MMGLFRSAMVICLLGAVFSRSANAKNSDADAIKEQLYILSVAKQAIDYDSPWRKGQLTREEHMAIAVGQNQLLTTAYAVAGASFLELTKLGTTKKIPAKVVFVDYEVDLAIIGPDADETSDKVAGSSRALVFGDILRQHERVGILFTRDNINLKQKLTDVSEIEVNISPTSSYLMPFYLLEIPETSGFGWSEAVMQNGKLVAITSGHQKNAVSAIPVNIIKRFLQDFRDQKYNGFPFIGVGSAPLLDPFYRKLLKADVVAGGVRVADVFVNSPFINKLQKDDVLLAIDGTPIDDQGLIKHPVWGPIFFSVLINEKRAGDVCTLDILRKGERLKLRAALSRFDRNQSLLRYFNPDDPDPHVIFGGLILQELSRGYMMKWGSEWGKKAPEDLLYLSEIENRPTSPLGRRKIILNRVLADEFNRGYTQRYEELIVEKVNGEAVYSIEDVRRLLKEKPVVRDGKRYAVFSLAMSDGDVILTYDNLAAAHERIAKQYGVSSKMSFFGGLEEAN